MQEYPMKSSFKISIGRHDRYTINNSFLLINLLGRNRGSDPFSKKLTMEHLSVRIAFNALRRVYIRHWIDFVHEKATHSCHLATSHGTTNIADRKFMQSYIRRARKMRMGAGANAFSYDTYGGLFISLPLELFFS